MIAQEKGKDEPAVAKLSCHICGLTFTNENEKQKHLELEHMKNRKPAGVR
ncbi:MAG: hypothetical protein ACREBU_25110 [Nitrososphaera sp.]